MNTSYRAADLRYEECLPTSLFFTERQITDTLPSDYGLRFYDRSGRLPVRGYLLLLGKARYAMDDSASANAALSFLGGGGA